MSVTRKIQSPARQISQPRSILGLGGNRCRVSEEQKMKKEGLKKPQQPKKFLREILAPTVRNDLSLDMSERSLDSSYSSASSSSCNSGKIVNSGERVKQTGLEFMEVVSDGIDMEELCRRLSALVKRCGWITPNSDPLYISFHDEEWGVPVDDDRKLFELLVLSQALAEFSWPSILHKRDIFRKLLDNFEPSSIAKFTDKKLTSLKVNGSSLLSEPKLRAIVQNAKQTLQIQHEFGSFSNYIWSFVKHKPITNGFRYPRQVPAKTPKAEHISKDLMNRGFRCVGPTVVYSFMQVAGIVNDHLSTCFRYQECNADVKKDLKSKIEETEEITKDLENTSLPHK